MKRKIVISLLVLMTYSLGNSQEIKWYSWNEGYEASKKENKKILVFVHADWCHLCNRMLSITFTSDSVMPLMNKDYIAIKFNFEKESEKNVTYNFNGEKYNVRKLIGFLLNAKEGTPVELGVPLTVFLDITTNNRVPEMGFKSPSELKSLLQKYSGKV